MKRLGSRVVRWQDKLTRLFHQGPVELPMKPELKRLISRQHWCNIRLWHLEDQARREDVLDSVIASVKRKIDRENQQRNDAIEALDQWFLNDFAKRGWNSQGEVHSETLGAMIDRLSILSLKIYHVDEESKRRDASHSYRVESRKKLSVLKVQRRDLKLCFDALLEGIAEGRKQVKMYFQFKLYNDPQSNPALYKREKLKGKNLIF